MSRREAKAKQGGCVRQVLTALALIGAALPGAIWIVMQYPGEDWWGGAVLVYAPTMQWIALPVFGLIFAMVARRRWLIFLNIAAVAFALFVVGGYQLNIPPPLPEDRPTIRLATWNIYGWTRDRDLVRDRIMSWDCDIVCLQEASSVLFEDLLPGYESVGAGDLRTFVRGRILNKEAPRNSSRGHRRMLKCEVETDAGRFTVINTHIPRTEETRKTPREIRPLIEYIKTGADLRGEKFARLFDLLPQSGSVIVAGDMNTPPPSKYYAQMSDDFTDSFAAVGQGFGNTFLWRKKLPTFRIDYVWTGRNIEPLRSETKHHLPSDHRPLVTALAPLMDISGGAD